MRSRRESTKPKGNIVKGLESFLRSARLVVVLGVGNELKGDDAAGVLVARELAKAGAPKIVALEAHTAPEAMVGKIEKLKPSHVLIVDAAEIGRKPGEWDLIEEADVDGGFTSTHHIPLTTIARRLGEVCGCEVAFLGIQCGGREFGAKLSKGAAKAVKDVVTAVSKCAK